MVGAMDLTQRRRHPRLYAHLLVSYRVPDGPPDAPPRSARVVNLSASGILALLPEMLAVSTVVELTGSVHEVTFSITAEVIRQEPAHPATHQIRHALRFVMTGPKDHEGAEMLCREFHRRFGGE